MTSMPQTLRILENSHVNRAFSEEACDCESSSATPDGCSDKSYEPEWAENIGPKGELFFIEPRYKSSFGTRSVAASDKSSGNDSQVARSKGFGSEAKNKIRSLVGRKKVKHHSGDGQLDVSQCRKEPSLRSFNKAECIEVFIDVDPARHNYGRRATICEALFGIIPGSLPSRLATAEMLGECSPVMVQGLLPDGEAIKTGAIKIGDVLRSVDGSSVNEKNIDSILRGISKAQKVKLQFVRPEENTLAGCDKYTCPQSIDTQSSLIKQLTGDSAMVQQVKQQLHQIPHAFLYQGFCSDMHQQSEPAHRTEHFYRFPDHDHTLSNLRGMFVTLSCVLGDVTATKPQGSSLTVDGHLVHVAYFHKENGIAVLCLPAAHATPEEVHIFLLDIVKLLKLEYRSLSQAFSTVEAHSCIDLFLLHFFREMLLDPGQEGNKLRFIRSLPHVHWLHLPMEAQAHVDTVLSELESADVSEAFDRSSRCFTFLGSCAFYKGFLLGNHLPRDYLESVFLYCRHYQLLTLTKEESVGQVVVWKEIYLQDDFATVRHFVLIVGLKHSLILSLLEVGGCASVSEENPAPDAFYIDRVQNSLLQLESLGVLSVAESCLLNCGSAPGSTASSASSKSWCQSSMKDSHSSLSLSVPPSLSPRRARKSSSDVEQCYLLHCTSNHFDCSEHDPQMSRSYSSCSESNGLRARHCSISTSSDCDSRTSGSDVYQGRDEKLQRAFTSSYDLSSLRRSLEDGSSQGQNQAQSSQSVACADENLVFHYLSIDMAEGVFVAPVECAHKSNLGAEIVENFYRCCLEIRKVFNSTAKDTRTAREDEIECESKFLSDRSLSCVKEHGVLFTCPSSSSSRSRAKGPISYWVVGRLFADKCPPREVYVCMHEDASSTALEIAFRLSFGLQI
ncbi:inturned planar cell polarity protein [Dermacentor variabilis]|uniref:inturned planar cell polarity protein n=1 Tax=Dermacentor variabilis TaxID=34621 RepID=UPI003F5C612E